MLSRKMLVVALAVLVVGGAYATIRNYKVAPLSPQFAALQTCEVHGGALQLGTAPILYGDRPPLITDPVASATFPRAYSSLLGGCVVEAGSPSWAEVKFCPQCRAAEGTWLTAHPTSAAIR
ncbi:hypothetical protein EON80_21905 [bacterium]|nr:MAG: hypothetical protein EON80_21905 [bacterium]